MMLLPNCGAAVTVLLGCLGLLVLKQANASTAACHFGMANGAQAPAVLQPKG